jgi:hypothetical protein
VEKDDVAKRDGKTRKIFNITENHTDLDNKYIAFFPPISEIGTTGLLKIGNLNPADAERYKLPIFRIRWDEKADAVDVDAYDSQTDSIIREFEDGRNGSWGHHSQKLDTKPRTFAIEVGWEDKLIYSGQVSFNLHKEAEFINRIGL